MAYQVAKTIGSMYCVLSGEVNAILLTGGMVHSAIFMDELQGRIEKIAPVHTFPSEDDVDTLAANGYYILRGDITVQEYPA
jgi:butyrate kinase